MLPRALNSLLNQTYTNWVCELHCDKPDNTFPKELVSKLNDSRIIYKHHNKNLGLTRSFNLAFEPIKESYRSILEEDNWWYPNFLTEMIEAHKAKPTAKVVWSNMRIWYLQNNVWVDSKKNVWNVEGEGKLVEFNYPHPIQISGALHSQGAMVMKVLPEDDYTIPYDFDSGFLEAIRERKYPFPIVLNTSILTNYAMLETSHRSKKRHISGIVQLLLMESFIAKIKSDEATIKNILNKARHKPYTIQDFVLVTLINSKCRWLLKYFVPKDFILFVAYYIKNILELILKFIKYKELRQLREFLFLNTRTGEIKSDIKYIYYNENCPHG